MLDDLQYTNINNQLIDQPYEKCILMGESCLSDVELLAVILKSGVKGITSLELAKMILTMPDGSVSILALVKKSYRELIKIKGVKKSKALSIKCIAEISRRISLCDYSNNSYFHSSKDISGYFMESMRHLNQEQTRLILLNGSGRFLGSCIISIGTSRQSLLSPREIFQKALEYSADYFVLLHNHPSGDPSPSADDYHITDVIIAACEIMNIFLIDHIIIGDNKYFSMKDAGYIK